MLWTVCHLWWPQSHFVYNCYRHWSSLVLKNGNGMDSFLHSSKGVTQWDLLCMVVYGIGILLLIKNLKAEFPDFTQPSDTDNYGSLDTFARFRSYFNFLKRLVLGQRYYPEPSKRVSIVHQENPEAGKL